MKKEVHELAEMIRKIGKNKKIREENTYMGQDLSSLSDTEKVLFYSDVFSSASVGFASKTAIASAQKYFTDTGDGTQANAYQHALWNALSIVNGASESFVESFTNAHEYGNLARFFNANETMKSFMDLYNNKQGRKIGVQALKYGDPQDIIIAVNLSIEAVKNGTFIFIDYAKGNLIV